MSNERLNRINDMIEKAIDDKEIPGAVALVARNGKIVYHKAFGIANSELGSDVNPGEISGSSTLHSLFNGVNAPTSSQPMKSVENSMTNSSAPGSSTVKSWKPPG